MNSTEIKDGKRVINQYHQDGSISKILQVFKECKMEESKLVNLDKYMFSLLAKSGIDTISVLIDKEEHKYPDFILAINKNHIKKWDYQHDISATLLWVRKHNHPNITDPYLGLEGVLNEIIDSVREEWSNH